MITLSPETDPFVYHVVFADCYFNDIDQAKFKDITIFFKNIYEYKSSLIFSYSSQVNTKTTTKFRLQMIKINNLLKTSSALKKVSSTLKQEFQNTIKQILLKQKFMIVKYSINGTFHHHFNKSKYLPFLNNKILISSKTCIDTMAVDKKTCYTIRSSLNGDNNTVILNDDDFSLHDWPLANDKYFPYFSDNNLKIEFEKLFNFTHHVIIVDGYILINIYNKIKDLANPYFKSKSENNYFSTISYLFKFDNKLNNITFHIHTDFNKLPEKYEDIIIEIVEFFKDEILSKNKNNKLHLHLYKKPFGQKFKHRRFLMTDHFRFSIEGFNFIDQFTSKIKVPQNWDGSFKRQNIDPDIKKYQSSIYKFETKNSETFNDQLTVTYYR